MNVATKISVCLNFALVGALAYVLTSSKPDSSKKESKPPEGNDPAALGSTDTLGGTRSPAVSAISGPFRWSQVESPDYRVYVANLRGVGCPEQTIRDIIAADVDNLYSVKRRELRLDGIGAGPWSRQEQQQLTASLLGSSLGSDRSDSGSLPAGSSAPAVRPLVLQSIDPSALGLDSGQMKAIAELREQFVAAVGGPGQDPSDPAYRERWEKAQPENDEMLRGMIGVNAFQNYRLEAEGVHVGTGQ